MVLSELKNTYADLRYNVGLGTDALKFMSSNEQGNRNLALYWAEQW